jgi:hypothetical protein
MLKTARVTLKRRVSASSSLSFNRVRGSRQKSQPTSVAEEAIQELNALRIMFDYFDWLKQRDLVTAVLARITRQQSSLSNTNIRRKIEMI